MYEHMAYEGLFDDLPDLRAGGLGAVVAANIRYEAARRGLTQQDLGEIVGRSRPAISQRATGKVPWSLDDVGRLAPALGMRPGDLLVAPETARARSDRRW
ncbi:helix-turn-helix domain-containing protein [Georgenia muralis]|uniref:DNA-binding Xre family transcriptional regulator n=1 Tax=Georgenia muralis TaxID=154117 RepID=A0A3N4Z009_9MICO|nr:helix-turn-helix transcriptional regulator [Georgenia muralis]RPF25877.1 DNA-binding Xre family transcriptional regulator [Georgenia muralis]